MRVTHRRLNLAQAHKVSGKSWCTMAELRRYGAYGEPSSIHRAMQKMKKEGVAEFFRTRQGYHYRITSSGYAKLGMVPHKIQGQDDEIPGQGNPEGSPAPRAAGS